MLPNARYLAKPSRGDVLVLRIDRLSRALNAPIPSREREWARTLEEALAGVERALRQHMATALDPEGVFAEIDETRPTLARQTHQLRQNHGVLLEQCLALRKELRWAMVAFSYVVPDLLPLNGSPERADGRALDLGDIRHRGEELRNGLHQNARTETQLILECITRDIGVAD
jgi:hypothetical protein